MKEWFFRRLSALLVCCLLISAVPAFTEDAGTPEPAVEAEYPAEAEIAGEAFCAEYPAEAESAGDAPGAEGQAAEAAGPEQDDAEDADISVGEALEEDVADATDTDAETGLFIDAGEAEDADWPEPDQAEGEPDLPDEAADEEEFGDTQLMAPEQLQEGYAAVAARTVVYCDAEMSELLGTFIQDGVVYVEAVEADGGMLRVRFDTQEARDWALTILTGYVSVSDVLPLTEEETSALKAELLGDVHTRSLDDWPVPCAMIDAAGYSFIAAKATASELGVAAHTEGQIQAFVDANPAYRYQINIYSAAETTDPYASGRLSAVNQQSALNMVNQVRYIAGISADLTPLTLQEAVVADTALVLRLNNRLSHAPGRPAALADGAYDELFNRARSGAGSSNIAMGYTATSSILAYMSDSDSGNISTVGHRRWILNPRMGKTIFGASGRFSAMYAHDLSGYGMQTKVAWPAQEMPIQYFSANDPWSVSFGRTLDADKIEVSLVRVADGRTWRFSADHSDGFFNVENSWYGQVGCVIFRPDSLKGLAVDDRFNVTITDLAADEVIRYTVHFFSLNLTSSQPLADVTGVEAKRWTDGVHLGWNAVPGASGYYVCRRKESGNYQIVADVSDATQYLDTGVTEDDDAAYTYQVYAHTASLTSKSAVGVPAEKLVPHSVTLNWRGTVSLYSTLTLPLTAEVQPAGAITRLTWTSSNARVARVDENGLVTPLKKGTTYISVSTDNGLTASIKLKVLNPPKPKKVKIYPKGTVWVALGSTLQLSAAFKPYYAASKLTWRTSNSRIAKVSKYGKITPRREGTAYITVRTGNGKSARVKVRVYDPYKPTGVSLDPAGTVEIKVGESLQLNAVLTPENARTTLTWVTSNKKIASVYSSGVVYGRRPGTVAITVYTKNGKKARMYVRVVA